MFGFSYSVGRRPWLHQLAGSWHRAVVGPLTTLLRCLHCRVRGIVCTAMTSADETVWTHLSTPCGLLYAPVSVHARSCACVLIRGRDGRGPIWMDLEIGPHEPANSPFSSLICWLPWRHAGQVAPAYCSALNTELLPLCRIPQSSIALRTLSTCLAVYRRFALASFVFWPRAPGSQQLRTSPETSKRLSSRRSSSAGLARRVHPALHLMSPRVGLSRFRTLVVTG